jgi:hypothetical protein
LVGHKADELLQRKAQAGMMTAAPNPRIQTKSKKVRDDFPAFSAEVKRQRKTVFAFVATAKGNTLMDYAGRRPGLISFVIDW